jgi:dethiobiotin synthetase
VKDWEALSAAITAHKHAGEIEDACDMAILAYNRNLGGKQLVYELTSLLTKLKRFDEAEELFDEYEKMASHDMDRYILFYELRKAEGAPSSDLVEILEEYRNGEIIEERYLYELAKLYSKAGRKKECIRVCDEIATVYPDGSFAVKALKMKQYNGGKFTEKQEEIIAKARTHQLDEESTKEMLFEQQMDPLRYSENEEAEIKEMLDGTAPVRKTADLSQTMQELKEKAAHADDVDYTEFETELDENGVNRKLKRFVLAQVEASKKVGKQTDRAEDGVKADDDSAAFTPEMYPDDEAAATVENPITADTTEVVGSVEKAEAESDNAQTDETEAESNQAAETASEDAQTYEPAGDEKISQASESLKELIAKARKNIDSTYDQINREAEQEKREKERREAEEHIRAREDAMQIDEVAVPGNNIYDTQNLQAEIARNLSAVLDDEDFGQDTSMFRPNPAQETQEEEPEADENEQIDGQLSIADWIETVREEKYGSQDTKEYSKSELNRILDQKEENSAAYEKMLEEKRQGKKASVEVSKGNTQEMLIEAKTDLAIRTGKASQKLEEAVEVLKEAAAAAGEISNEVGSAADESDVEEVAAAVSREATASVENVSLDTARLDTVPEEVLAEYVEREMATEQAEKRPFSGAGRASTQVAPKKTATARQPVKTHGELKLDSNLSRYFKKYKEMSGLESQIAEYFRALPTEMQDTTSRTGNIIISGNSSSDKYDLAKAIVRAINSLYPDEPRKIAKTTGESINHRGIEKSMQKLRGTVLVIEGAGVMKPKRVRELLDCMEGDTKRMIVIMEDADAEIKVLMEYTPELAEKFNHRMVLKQYSVHELVEMARQHANRRSYEVEDDALLELYQQIDKMRISDDHVKVDDVKDIINRAIEHSEKRASRKFFKGIKKKRTKNGEFIYLTEADFKG